MSRSTLPPRPTTIPPPPASTRTTHRKRILEQVETAEVLCKVKGGCPLALFSVRNVEDFRKELRRLARRLAALEERLAR